MDLRWVFKDGKKVLQMREEYTKYTASGVIGMPYIEKGDWKDVPVDYKAYSTDKPMNLVDERTIGE
jgi:hypothetical protein